MRWEDASYLGAVTLAAGAARAMRRGLPPGVRLRLEADLPETVAPGWIWLHAVSVGELILAEGVLGWLRDQGYRIHVTTGTIAGRDVLGKRLGMWDVPAGCVTGGAFPVDDPLGLRPFFERPPMAFIALETELWPNLLRELEARGIPRIIVNGRLTERSLGAGAAWTALAASRLTRVAARDEASAQAFRALGAPQVALGGNLKADLPPPRPLHEGWNPLRHAWARSRVLVAGNTLEGEEELLTALYFRLKETCPDLRMILAPRQPKRFQEVAAGFTRQRLRFRRASGVWPMDPESWEACDVLLLDTLGELPSAYREGTVALVAGGWTSPRGHNPLEPVRWGVPTVIGPGYRNFEDLALPLAQAKLLEIAEADALDGRVLSILEQAPRRPGPALAELPPSLQGALGRTCAILKDVLPPPR